MARTELPNDTYTDSYEDYEDVDLDEGAEDGGDELDDYDGDEEMDGDEETDDEEDDDADVEGDDDADATDDADGTPASHIKFTAEQQKAVDKIVQSRLERKDAQFAKHLSQAAGTALDAQEIPQAAKLWGLLKSNPELSEAVDMVIQAQLKHGRAKEVTNTNISRESALDLKEAVLDLKLADPTFRKHADTIMDWADEQGYAVDNPKALKLALMAWKGSQEAILSKAKRSSEQKRKDSKQATQKRAGVQSGTTSKARPMKSDLRKMSDKDILSRTGMKLFTDD